MNSGYTYRVEENIHRNTFGITGVEYIYEETRAYGDIRKYRVKVNRNDYEALAIKMTKATLPFDSFVKVLRPFMMGIYAAADIPQAFLLLDRDRSGTIDIGELAAFMPVIVPNATPYMLLHYVQKVDKNADCKLNLLEFTDLVKRGVGRDLALGRL